MDESRHLMRGAARLRFPDDLEERFRDDYYQNSIVLCRVALLVSWLMWVTFGLLDPYAVPLATRGVWFIRFFLVAPAYGALTLLSFSPFARKYLQTAVSCGLLVVGMGLIAMAMLASVGELGFLFYPLGLLLEAMVGYSFLRLRFWYATIPNLVLVAIYGFCAIFGQDILHIPQGKEVFIHNSFFLITANLAGIGTCYSLELYARRAFISNYLLELERAGEQRKRERTEAMLQVLGQAIGAIVHDLGTPLTAVQTGAQTLEQLSDDDECDPEMLKVLTGIIIEGAEMLNHQRLSLMEQTRVLEGKPIPLQLSLIPMRELVESALRLYPKQLAVGGRLSFHGDEIEITADRLKMTTVLMNLIGNALKYSDGKVSVFWRVHGDWVLLAVADQGWQGQGLTRAQADQLFVAFGRLDIHTEVKGTGLGLLSVRKIIETHGGEVFIEGGQVPAGTAFSTARNAYPPLLEEPFHNAFVLVCPFYHPKKAV